MKDFFKILIIILFCVGIIAMVILGCYAEVKQSIEYWNNGICENCGGEYKFSGATHVKNSGDYYYYTCEECGHTIKTCQIMK